MIELILKPLHFGYIPSTANTDLLSTILKVAEPLGKVRILICKPGNLALQFVELCRVKCRC